jgi:hypothetical protein
MGPAPSVGKVFFPLDEELELLPGNLAPRQQEHVIHLACWMPFDKAACMVERLLGVQTNEETVRCLSERLGKWMQEAQTAELDNEEEDKQDQKDYVQRCAMSCDGAMVPLTHRQWAEVRTIAIGEPEEKRNAKGEREIHVGKLSYFSRLADASTFIDLAQVEMRRRGVYKAREASATVDGADWCQTFTDMHRPDAVRILDFPHGSEHINELLAALRNAGLHFPDAMLKRCLHVLKHRGPRPLLRMADRLPDSLSQKEEVRAQLNYLCKREAMMQYPQFQRDGWPIGSGMVESANKNVVETRLKGPGMHWERKNVNPMLALRNAVCNNRWQEMWRKAFRQYQQQEALRRTERVEQRLTVRNPALLSSPALPPEEVSSQSATPAGVAPVSQPAQEVSSSPQPATSVVSSPVPSLSQPAATLAGSSRPSAYHPWKRSPACRPSARTT